MEALPSRKKSVISKPMGKSSQATAWTCAYFFFFLQILSCPFWCPQNLAQCPMHHRCSINLSWMFKDLPALTSWRRVSQCFPDASEYLATSHSWATLGLRKTCAFSLSAQRLTDLYSVFTSRPKILLFNFTEIITLIIPIYSMLLYNQAQCQKTSHIISINVHNSMR